MSERKTYLSRPNSEIWPVKEMQMLANQKRHLTELSTTIQRAPILNMRNDESHHLNFAPGKTYLDHASF